MGWFSVIACRESKIVVYYTGQSCLELLIISYLNDFVGSKFMNYYDFKSSQSQKRH